MFEEILDDLKIPNYTWHLVVPVEESIKNYFYKILSEKEGNTSVKLMLSEKDHADNPCLSEEQMSSLLKGCEESIIQLVKDHQIRRESESEEHSSSCVICLNEKALLNIVDGGTPLFEKSIQDMGMGHNKPTMERNRVLESLDPEPAEEPKLTTIGSFIRQISREKSREPTTTTEEGTGTKEPSSSDDFTYEFDTKVRIVDKTEDYASYKSDIMDKNKAHENYWVNNKQRILNERGNHPDGEANYALTYLDKGENKITHKLFPHEQEALQWAYHNEHLMEQPCRFIRVWNLQFEERRALGASVAKWLEHFPFTS